MQNKEYNVLKVTLSFCKLDPYFQSEKDLGSSLSSQPPTSP
jgi:hypothetical protein